MNRTLILALALTACGTAATPTPAEKPPPPPPAAPAPAPVSTAAPATAPAGPGDAALGEATYTTYCAACHQADGTGLNGMLAANFVADPTRLAKSDEELLTVIRDGKTGKVGVMPPWGTTLNEQQRRDVLAYIRSKFQKAP